MVNHTPAAPIVVGIDGSESSIGALREARLLAERLDRSFVVVASWQVAAFQGAGVLSVEWDPVDSATAVLDDAVIDVYGRRDPERVTKRVVEGSPAAVLIDESVDAYMLVVGSRGHGGFAGLLLGSVSTAVAEHARCPVLVVH